MEPKSSRTITLQRDGGKTRAKQSLLLFAYGTLITGALEPQVQALLAEHVVARQAAWVTGRLFDLGDYPGALPSPKCRDRIHGELIELSSPSRCLPVIDAYEGWDPRRPGQSLYRREEADVWLDDGNRIRASLYWLNLRPANAVRITHGDWTRWMREKAEPSGD